MFLLNLPRSKTHAIVIPSHSTQIQPLLQYVIFPAQFAFLYSYHPTGNMDDLPAQLEASWKAKHFEDAEKAFERVAKNGQDAAGPSFFQNAKADGGGDVDKEVREEEGQEVVTGATAAPV